MPKQKRFQFSWFAQLAPASAPSWCSQVSHHPLSLSPLPTSQEFSFSFYFSHSLSPLYIPLHNPSPSHHLYSIQKSLLFSLLPSKMAIPFKLLLSSLIVMSSLMVSYGGNFYQDFDITWGDQRAKIFSGGQLLSLSLDKTSGSGFISKKEYLFGRIDMQLKLVAGNSAGTVTAYYLSSQGPTHDEIDFEFLGNLSGDPYIVHTNVFTQGKGNREQQFYLWFDPTRNFHTYSIVWTSQQIIFLVDNTPIRVFKNGESIGVPFPKNQPMKIYSSLWNADDWATRGGLVKADWTKAPFTAYYRGFNVQTCTGSCTSSVSGRTWQSQELDAYSRRRLRWVQKNFMIYNYCTDLKRFPQGLPPECKRSRFL